MDLKGSPIHEVSYELVEGGKPVSGRAWYVSRRYGRGSRNVWALSAEEGLSEAVAMDGKTLCGTLQGHQRAVYLLSMLDHRTGCTLSQVPR